MAVYFVSCSCASMDGPGAGIKPKKIYNQEIKSVK